MNQTAKEVNPFAGSPSAHAGNGALAHTDQQRAIAEVQAAMVIARSSPRNQMQAMDRIINACTRPSLAESALYQYSRGGSDITGPSIRLAEVLAQGWGNMQYGIRELDQHSGASTVQAYAWDVEANTRREVTFHVPHTRHTRNGSYALTDPRDIYEHVANQGARRLRACILGIIPGDVIEAAVKQCEVTLKASADTSPEGVKKMVDAFAGFGVTKEMIEGRIQRRLDSIQPAQIVGLKKIYASLRDGMSVATDWFGASGTPADTPRSQPQPEKPACPDEKIGLMLGSIRSGDMTADSAITMLSSRYTLNDDQKRQMREAAVVRATQEEKTDENT